MYVWYAGNSITLNLNYIPYKLFVTNSDGTLVKHLDVSINYSLSILKQSLVAASHSSLREYITHMYAGLTHKQLPTTIHPVNTL